MSEVRNVENLFCKLHRGRKNLPAPAAAGMSAFAGGGKTMERKNEGAKAR